jgi:hypothetical protein
LSFIHHKKDQSLKANELLKAHFKLKATHKEAQIDDFKPFPKVTIQSSKPPAPFSSRCISCFPRLSRCRGSITKRKGVAERREKKEKDEETENER